MITVDWYDHHKKDRLTLKPFDLAYYHFDSDEFVYEYEATIEDLAEYTFSEMRVRRDIRSNVDYRLIITLYQLGWFDKLTEDDGWLDAFYYYLLDEKESEAREAYKEMKK